MQDTGKQESQKLANLLAELQKRIETNPDLSDLDKLDALEQLKVLAIGGQNPINRDTQNQNRKAMKILEATIAGIPAATKLAVETKELLIATGKLLSLG